MFARKMQKKKKRKKEVGMCVVLHDIPDFLKKEILSPRYNRYSNK